MRPRVLTALTADITTASVTIKSLTIEKKQVTLAVFRQLIEEEIFDWEKMALMGIGWGHVRYLIDVGPDQGINLVWQKDNELRRCIVMREAPPIEGVYPNSYDRDAGEIMLTFGNYDSTLFWRGSERYFNHYYVHRWKWLGRYYPGSKDLKNITDICGKHPSPVGHTESERKAWKEECEAWQDKCIRTIDNWQQACQRDSDAALRWVSAQRSRYAMIVKPLFNLPQLFIAV